MQAGAASFSTGILATHALAADGVSAIDRERMRSVAAFTAETLSTDLPMPFGADIVSTATGERLMRAVNRVGPDHDPSAHAETLTIRLACAKLGSGSLKGYTLYTTCEPCAMCMACALWSGLDRLVFGATIADAGRFVSQIRIPAKEVARRTPALCGGWAGRARGLRETLYRSAHAKGVCNVEEALSELWDVKSNIL